MERLRVSGKIGAEKFSAEFSFINNKPSVLIIEGNILFKPNLQFLAPIKPDENYLKAWLQDYYRIEGRGRRIVFN